MHWFLKSILAAALLCSVIAVAAGIILANLYTNPRSSKQTPVRQTPKESTSEAAVPLHGIKAADEKYKTSPSTGEIFGGQSNLRVSEQDTDTLEGVECVMEAKASSTENLLQGCRPPYLCIAEPNGITGRCRHPDLLPDLHASCDPANPASCGTELRCSRSTSSCEPALLLGERCDPPAEEMCASGLCRPVASTQTPAVEGLKEAVHGHVAAQENVTTYGEEYTCQRLVACGEPCDSTFSHCSGPCSVCGEAGVCEAPPSKRNKVVNTIDSGLLLPDTKSDDGSAGHADALRGEDNFENSSGEDEHEREGVGGQHEKKEEEKETSGVQVREDGDRQHFHKTHSETQVDERPGQHDTPDDEVREPDEKGEGNKSSHENARAAETDVHNASDDQEMDLGEQSQDRAASVTGRQATHTSNGNPTTISGTLTTQAKEDGMRTTTGEEYNEAREKKHSEGGDIEKFATMKVENHLQRDNSEQHRLQIVPLPLEGHQDLDVQKHKGAHQEDESDKIDKSEAESTRPVQRPPQPVQRLDTNDSLAVTVNTATKKVALPQVQPLRKVTSMGEPQALSFHDSENGGMGRVPHSNLTQSSITQPHPPAGGAKPEVIVSHDASQLGDQNNGERSDDLPMIVSQVATHWSGVDPMKTLAEPSVGLSTKTALPPPPVQRQSSKQDIVHLSEPYEQRPHDWQKVQQRLRERQQHHDASNARQARWYLPSQRTRPQVPPRHSGVAQISREGELSQGPLRGMAGGWTAHHNARQGDRQHQMQQQEGNGLLEYEQEEEQTLAQPAGIAQPTYQTSPVMELQNLWRLWQEQQQVGHSRRPPEKVLISEQRPPEKVLNSEQRPPEKVLNSEQRPPEKLLDSEQRPPEKVLNSEQRPPEKVLNSEQRPPEKVLNSEQRPPEKVLNSEQQPPEKVLNSEQRPHKRLNNQGLQQGGGTWRIHPTAGMMWTGVREPPGLENTLQPPPSLAESGPQWGDHHQEYLKKVNGDRSRSTQDFAHEHGFALSDTYDIQHIHRALEALYKAKDDTAERFDALMRALPGAKGASHT